MPLRSVEAASRDDAIAAAREQFGPQARVVGVRRVRSGGVLGFFATERYVAEVAEPTPEATVRAAVPARSSDDDAPPAGFSSPLPPAAPARARAVAPARNGAAAWAAAARVADDIPDEVRAAAAAARAARSNAPATYPRATFPRTATVSRSATSLPDDAAAAPVRGGGQKVVPAAAPATPSPFTAALARMVAGDQDVRQAVQDALPQPPEERPRDDAEQWPVRSEPVRTADPAVPPVGHEEDTEGDQVSAPPFATDRPVGVPTWAAAPEEGPASTSAREEAIADLLRGALAQGHSDEALAGILRKVLDGATPRTALSEPIFAVPSWPVPSMEAPVVDEPVLDLPARAEPVLDLLAAPSAPNPFPSSTTDPVAEATVTETPDAQEAVAAEADEPVGAHEPVEVDAGDQALEECPEEALDETREEADVVELASVLARTASDPAPMMSLDATAVMPPLSLLPPLPSPRGRGRPPVPPAMPRTSLSSSSSPRPAATAPAKEAEDVPSDADGPEIRTPAIGMPTDVPASGSLATVTRLRVAPLLAAPVTDTPAAAPAALPSGDVAEQLRMLGLPTEFLGGTFDADVAELGTYAALTRTLGRQLPAAPELPRGAGEAVFVVGPGADALRAARSLAASLHLDPGCVQWATRGDLAGLAPRNSRITSVDAAIDRRQVSVSAGTVTIVAIDEPLRTDASWMAEMVSVWAPVAVWAVVEATRKPEDLEQWIDGLPRVDALIVQDVDLSADPAAVLRRVDAPVALLDGVRATPHRWASLLCERLESTTT